MPGTVPVDEDTFTAYLSSVIAGFWNTGFRKQILLNGHGQEYVIPTAIHRFAKRYQVPSILINLNWYYAIQPFIKDKAHGGPFETPFTHADEAETSYSLALFPEMIKMEDAVDTEFHGRKKNHLKSKGICLKINRRADGHDRQLNLFQPQRSLHEKCKLFEKVIQPNSD